MCLLFSVLRDLLPPPSNKAVTKKNRKPVNTLSSNKGAVTNLVF